MVIVQLGGGLGNQMFEYACANAIALRNSTHVVVDTTALHYYPAGSTYAFRECGLDIFNCQPRFTVLSKAPKFLRNTAFRIQSKINRLIPEKNYFLERDSEIFSFNPAVFAAPDNCRIEGLWQNIRYFSDCENEIRKLFSGFRLELSRESANVFSLISSCNSVCVNFRRTDFVSDPQVRACMGNLDLNYYETALDQIQKRVDKPHLFVFSDDIAWCEKNFKSKLPLTFVGHECAGKKFSDYFRLMNACKHFIIPNSTFAWWAAWLNTSISKIVVAPRRWIANPEIDVSGILPREWIQL